MRTTNSLNEKKTSITLESFLGGYCTSPNLFIKKTGKPDPNGILSEIIFGPVSSYKCSCGFLKHKTLDGGKICPKCHVICDDNLLRLKTFGKIKLVTPVFKYTKKNEIIKIIGKFYKQLLDPKQSDANAALNRFICVKNDKTSITLINDFSSVPDGYFIIPFRISGIFSLIFVLRYVAIELNVEVVKTAFDENYIIDEIDVLPPDSRPVFKDPKNPAVLRYENINKYYISLLNSNNRNKLFCPTISDEIKKWTESLNNKIQTNNLTEIENVNTIEYDQISAFYQTYCDLIYMWCFEHIRGKRGLIRSTSLSRTLEFSGRTVVVVDPNVKPYEISVPREMLYTLWMPYFLNYLVKIKKVMQFDETYYQITTKKYWEFKKDPILFKYFLEFLNWFSTSDDAKLIEY